MFPTTLFNFGHNLAIQPRVFVQPQTEREVLDLLERYRGRSIRCIGRLHSWSESAVGDDVVVDLRELNEIQVVDRDGEPWAIIGAGCQLKQVLPELERLAGVTLPTVGLITEQTLVGAAATGTHGSGRSSLSHYIDEVRVATYDPQTGTAVIRIIAGGPELEAARCSLGCLGVIVSVGVRCRPRYQVEEHFQRYERLEEVLSAEQQYPLQQFFFVPWRWDYFVQHRREVDKPRSKLAGLYRWYFFLFFDLGLHWILLFLLLIVRSRHWLRFFFRHVLPLTVIRSWKVVDKSSAMLVMKHELFRHIEIELFVKRSQLGAALNMLQESLRYATGERTALSTATQQRLDAVERAKGWEQLCGAYTHHYPICVRRVLPDQTMISATSGWDEDGYAISLISYARPRSRAGFFKFAEVVSHAFAATFGARCHWGKVNPLDQEEIARLYPRASEFRDICRAADPTGSFRNPWLRRVVFGE